MSFFKVIASFDHYNLSFFVKTCVINYLRHCGCASTFQSFSVWLYRVVVYSVCF